MAFGVRPLLARRTIHARPCGVRRAFWCRFIRLSSRMLKLQQLQLPRLEPDGQPIESSQLAAEEPAETGCLLNFPDGKGGYRPCGRPVGADGVFCEAHDGQKSRTASL